MSLLPKLLRRKKSVRFADQQDDDSAPTTSIVDMDPYQVFHTYAYGTSAWLALQAAPLLLTPSLIVSMCASEPRRMTDLESYLCRSLGLTLIVLAVMALLLTGILPLTSHLGDELDGDGNSKDPYQYPTLTTTTVYHGIMAFYLYTRFQYFGSFAFAAGALFATTLFGIGLWVILFGSDKGRISKTTGADKRTSNFPFENASSAREKKKELKREERRDRDEDREERRKRKSVLRAKSNT